MMQSQSQHSHRHMSLSASPEQLISASMTTSCSAESHAELCANLKRNHIITSLQVYNAMLACDRKQFIPRAVRAQLASSNAGLASSLYSDQAVPIGQLSTMSSPSSHAVALQSLFDSIQSAGDAIATQHSSLHVLDIGSGSGYLTAALALCLNDANRSVRVTGVDHSATLIQQSLQALQQHHPSLLSTGRVAFRTCPSELSRIAAIFHSDSGTTAPKFDAIHIGFAVRDSELPASLIAMLRTGGVLLAPMPQSKDSHQQQLTLFRRSRDESVTECTNTPIMTCVFAAQRASAPSKDVDSLADFESETAELQRRLDAMSQRVRDWTAEFKSANDGMRPTLIQMHASQECRVCLEEAARLRIQIKKRQLLK